MRCAIRTVMEQWWKNQNTTSHDEKIFFEDHFFNGFLIPNFQDDHGHESFKNICCLKQHFLFFSTDESNFLIIEQKGGKNDRHLSHRLSRFTGLRFG